MKIKQNIYEKMFILLCLFSASYLTISCPCNIVLYCHVYTFYVFLLIPLLYVFFKQIYYTSI